MPNLKPFPSKVADFNLYVQTVVPYLVANKARLLVSATNVTNVTAQLTTWNAVFPASQNRNTRTQSIIDNKDNAKAAIMATLRTIFADIPASALTVEDRNTLNIAKKSTSRTPAAVPSTKPIAQVDTSRRLEHTISFTDENGSAAKPNGVRGCQIWFKIGDPALDPSELNYIATDTASPYTYHFNGENAGKNVYYWLRWENTRGELGPWSDVVMATVTG